MLQFCPECRNADIEKTVSRSGDGTATVTCPDCETVFEIPYLPLATLEGAPAVGKSTTAGRIRDTVDCAVYEGDMHIDLTNGNLSWDEICHLDFRICMTLHAAGQRALFVGGLHPHTLDDSPETRYFSRIERCALVCDDTDLRARLRERGMDDDAIDAMLDVNRWYREESPESVTLVNTTEATPQAVAERVVSVVGADTDG